MKPETTGIAQELAEALDMLLSVATDKRTTLPKGELYTEIAINLSRQALASAKAAGIEPTPLAAKHEPQRATPMTDNPKLVDMAHKILGKAFEQSLTHDTSDDDLARAFDLVCQAMTKRITDGQKQTIDSFLGLDISRPWRAYGDNPEYRRPVQDRRAGNG